VFDRVFGATNRVFAAMNGESSLESRGHAPAS
jgi:hypothetical protein